MEWYLEEVEGEDGWTLNLLEMRDDGRLHCLAMFLDQKAAREILAAHEWSEQLEAFRLSIPPVKRKKV